MRVVATSLQGPVNPAPTPCLGTTNGPAMAYSFLTAAGSPRARLRAVSGSICPDARRSRGALQHSRVSACPGPRLRLYVAGPGGQANATASTRLPAPAGPRHWTVTRTHWQAGRYRSVPRPALGPGSHCAYHDLHDDERLSGRPAPLAVPSCQCMARISQGTT